MKLVELPPIAEFNEVYALVGEGFVGPQSSELDPSEWAWGHGSWTATVVASGMPLLILGRDAEGDWFPVTACTVDEPNSLTAWRDLMVAWWAELEMISEDQQEAWTADVGSQFEDASFARLATIAVDADEVPFKQWLTDTSNAINSELDRVWVTAYEVTRHYGGPEEGGWWYNWYTPIETVPSWEGDRAQQVADKLRIRHAARAHGDIYSMAGGVEVTVIIDSLPNEMATTERPHYE